MSRKLVSYVHVMGEDGLTVAFGPDDEGIPKWATDQMGDHCFEPEPEPKQAKASQK